MAHNPGLPGSFEDLFITLTPEEWEILDEDQRRLYISVMMINLSLVISLGLPVSRQHIIPQQQSEDETRELERTPRQQQRESSNSEEVGSAAENAIIGCPDPTSQSMENEGASLEQGFPIRISDVRSLRGSREHIKPEEQPEDMSRELERAPKQEERESRTIEEVDARAATENTIMGWPDPNAHSMENDDASSDQSFPIIISDVRSLLVSREDIKTEDQSEDEPWELDRAPQEQQRESRITEEVNAAAATENMLVGWPAPTSDRVKVEDASSEQELPIISDVRSLLVSREDIKTEEQSDDEPWELDRAPQEQKRESRITEEVNAAAATENMLVRWPGPTSYRVKVEDASSEQEFPIIISDVRSLLVSREDIKTEKQSEDEEMELDRESRQQQRESKITEEINGGAATKNTLVGWPGPNSYRVKVEDASSEQELPIISDVRSLLVSREHIKTEDQSDYEPWDLDRAPQEQQRESRITEEVNAAAATENMLVGWPAPTSDRVKVEDASSEQELPIISDVRSLIVSREDIKTEKQSDDELWELDRAPWEQQREHRITEEVNAVAATENMLVGWPGPTSYRVKFEDASSEQELPIIISDVRSLLVSREDIKTEKQSEDEEMELDREPRQQQRESKITEEINGGAATKNMLVRWPGPNSYRVKVEDASSEQELPIISDVRSLLVSREDIKTEDQSDDEPWEVDRSPQEQKRESRITEEVNAAAATENMLVGWPGPTSYRVKVEDASSEQEFPIIISDVRSLLVSREDIKTEKQSEDEEMELDRESRQQQRESKITEEINGGAATKNTLVGWPGPNSYRVKVEDASSEQELPIISNVRSLLVSREDIKTEDQSDDEPRELDKASREQQRKSSITEEVNAAAATENMLVGWPAPTSYRVKVEDASSEQELPIISDVRSLLVSREDIKTEDQSDDEPWELDRAPQEQKRESRITEEVNAAAATENMLVGWPGPTSYRVKFEDASSEQEFPIIISDVRSLLVSREDIKTEKQSEDEEMELDREPRQQQRESKITEEINGGAATKNMLVGWPGPNSYRVKVEDASSEQELPIIISDVRSLLVSREDIKTEKQSEDEEMELDRESRQQQRESKITEEINGGAATKNTLVGWPGPNSYRVKVEDASSEQELPIISDVRSLLVSREHIKTEDQSDYEPWDLDRAPQEQQRESRITEEVNAAAATENMLVGWPAPTSYRVKVEDASSEQEFPIIISDVRSLLVSREDIKTEEQSDDEPRELDKASREQQRKSSITEEVNAAAATKNMLVGWPGPNSYRVKVEDASSEQELPIITDVRSLLVSREDIKTEELSEDEEMEPGRAPRQQQRESRFTEEINAAAATENMLVGWPDPTSYRVKNEDASSDQSFSKRISLVKNLQVGPSIQADKPVLKDNLHQSWKQWTSPRKLPYIHNSPERAFGVTTNPHQYIKQEIEDEFDRMNSVQASSVKSGRLQMAEKFSTINVSVDGLITSSPLDQHQATHSDKKPSKTIKCEETLHTEQKDYLCSEDGKASYYKEKSEQPHNTHQSQECHESCETSHVSEMSVSHSSSELPKETNRSYKCSDCSKSFVSRSHLLLHKKVHLAVKSYICDECGKSYHRKYHLTQHKRVHSGLRPFKCDECGKAYFRKDVLKVHQRTHTGIKFPCEECGKFFRHRFYVKIHMRIHSGIRPYVCDECGKSFIVKHHLNQHKKRIHTPSKPSSEINVENSSVAPPVSSYTREATMEQYPTHSIDVGKLTEDEAMDLST